MQLIDDQSAIKMVDLLLEQAIEKNVSDIHLEPRENRLEVRFRVDGVLHNQRPLDNRFASQIVGRIKVLSALDITQKRISQDGKFSFGLGAKKVDLRISTFPTVFGEKVVIRILDKQAQRIALDQLGFSKTVLQKINELIKRPYGFFLVTGPTGSGKTTTLYAALSEVYLPEKNIMTIEDPVEYSIDGITQSQINASAGFTFEHGMRSLLRQDPDIIMIGEIRDKQTARIAIEAALTGHLVLSTLHTNDAPSAIMRLMDMGIEPFLINATVTGILAQRLARKLCTRCREKRVATDEEKYFFEKQNVEYNFMYDVHGCVYCNYTGYKGRIGIFELLQTTHDLRILMNSHPHFDQLCAQAYRDGMKALAYDGAQKVAQGIISLKEFFRIIV